MSDYTQTTFFAPKDALTSGDPDKIILGAEVDPELSAISTAIATKVDTASATSGMTITGTSIVITPAQATALGVAPADTDLLLIGDASDSNNLKSITMTNLADRLAGTVTTSALANTNSLLGVDILNVTTQTGLDGPADWILMHDTSAAGLRKVTIDDLVGAASGAVPTTRTLTAGDGLIGGGDLSANRQFDVDMLGLEDLVDPNADRIYFWDDSAGLSTWLTPGQALSISATTLDVATATTTATGVAELATEAEARTGTDTTRTLTPEAMHGFIHTARFAGGSGTLFSESGDGSWSGTRVATGHYRVTHGYGNSDFHVFATVWQATGNLPFVANVVQQSSTTFEVKVYDNTNTLSDGFSRLNLMTLNVF